MKPLALCGFMGTCKSTAGKLVAQALGYDFIDTDAIVEQQQDRSISQIFAEDGEAAFRMMEEKAVNQALTCKNGVISLGGGAVLTPGVQEKLSQQAITVLLTATPKAISLRLQGDTTRPNLPNQDEESIAALMEKRNPFYQQCADATVDTTNKSPEEIAQDIIACYSAKGEGDADHL